MVASFVKRYWSTGPGTVGTDLEKGVMLLVVSLIDRKNLCNNLMKSSGNKSLA